MRVGAVTKVIIYFGIFLLSAGMVLQDSLVRKAEDINGYNAMNKVVISPKKPSEKNNTEGSITPDDVKKLSKVLQAADFSFAVESDTVITAGDKAEKLKMIATNHLYMNFYNMKFVSGRFFDKTENIEKSKVAVIDDELALKLFGSTDVAGMSVNLSGSLYRIVGVYLKGDCLIDKLSNPDISIVYIPSGTQASLGLENLLNSVELSNAGKDLSADTVKAALVSIGKSPDSFYISSYVTRKVLMEQKMSIMLFISGCVCIVLIFTYALRRVSSIIGLLKEEIKSCYLPDALNKIRFDILRLIPEISITLLLIWSICNIVEINFYIPPDSIPDQIIDLSFYIDQAGKSLKEGMESLGYVPPLIEIKMAFISGIINWVFYLQLFAGIPMLLMGFYLLRIKSIHFINAYTRCSFVFAVSVITGLLLLPVGIPLYINPLNLGVIYLFLLLLLLKFLKGKVNENEKNLCIYSDSFNGV